MWSDSNSEYITTHLATTSLTVDVGADMQEREAAPAYQVVEQEHIAIIKQLDKVLCNFHFVDTRAVCTIMLASGAVISGSAALSVLHPNRFIINDLDFFVTAKGYPTLLTFLLDHGYKVSISDVLSIDYADENIVLTLIHAVSKASINIVVSMYSHVIGTITKFHSKLCCILWHRLPLSNVDIQECWARGCQGSREEGLHSEVLHTRVLDGV